MCCSLYLCSIFMFVNIFLHTHNFRSRLWSNFRRNMEFPAVHIWWRAWSHPPASSGSCWPWCTASRGEDWSRNSIVVVLRVQSSNEKSSSLAHAFKSFLKACLFLWFSPFITFIPLYWALWEGLFKCVI